MLASSSLLLARRSAATTLASSSRGGVGNAVAPAITSLFDASTLRRWKSDDAGDVIGIDLGTTNSCVAIMVRAYNFVPESTWWSVLKYYNI
jgi:hypothetical protein